MSHAKLDAGRTDTFPASDPVSEFNLYRLFTMAMQADRWMLASIVPAGC